jgi:hypothetical protein
LEIAKLVLEYFKVLFSAPVVFAGVAILFFLLYREPVKGLLQRIAVIRFPGGAELSTSQSERQEQEANLSGKPLSTSQSVPLDLPALPPNNEQLLKILFVLSVQMLICGSTDI